MLSTPRLLAMCAAACLAAGTLGACAGPRSPQLTTTAAEPLTELAGKPDGFTPTDDGATLSFGETAYVVTTGFDTGLPVYWEVRVDSPRTLTVDQVTENIGQDPAMIGRPAPKQRGSGSSGSTGASDSDDETTTSAAPPPESFAGFSCFVATFTPVAFGTDGADISVALPSVTPVDDAGLRANFVERDDNLYCGLESNDPLPAYTGDITLGRSYERAVVTWAGKRDRGIVGTGVELATVVSPRNTAQPAQTIRWQD
ncbi:hypothetical protein [Corynebacterium liangguodongii]|uniref:Uncharacterized protein n=1 Tax=Corynebacterium liangguodongii TaxID=2079535 RepID=A0A2S0WFW8_9CORY|nr:hypothetical protein [Corynebacterium liangguodongii]AWB84626.1 hypothetical protein C3E79_09190 [Corynebacterium liangguodongii]PWB99634.1 hypothetical protein DF219_04970 [Corynebacterium liangguodongii]